MKKYLPILTVLATVKLVIQCFGNRNYGFHRDELLHLAVSEHLSWGYMEFPPLIALIGKLSGWLFDFSLMGTRLFPTLAGVAILVLCCAMAYEMGGKKWAVILAGVCVLAFFPYYRNHTLFQPVAFDQLFWALGYYLFIKMLKTKAPQYILGLGIVVGFGLLTKYTMGMWVLGAIVGLTTVEKCAWFKNRWLYLAAVLTFLVVLPNIIWQIQHDYPLIRHLQALKATQLNDIDVMQFVYTQLYFPVTLAISLIGIVAMVNGPLKPYRPVGVSAITIFFAMWYLGAKDYYLFALYPVLFAAGAARLSPILDKKPKLAIAGMTILLIMAIPFIPDMAPVLPIETYTKLYQKPEEHGRVRLSGDYADMFGWEAQVSLADSIFRSLSPEEQTKCVIWAENYGEAGALQIIGKQYGLPRPISRHGSFWLWGYGNPDATVWISLGNETNAVNAVFSEVTLVKRVTHRYAIDEENNIPVYLCRKPKVNIPEWWAAYKDHVFD